MSILKEKTVGWKDLNRELNVYRPMYCKVSLKHMMNQANKLGIYDTMDKKRIKVDKNPQTQKTKVDSKYFNPSTHNFY